MKYANRLTDEELREIYSLLTDSDKINELNITRNENSIDLEGYIEILEEDSNETLTVYDDYTIADYNVKVYQHSGYCTLDYRKWMYRKFGDEYARDYLLNNY